jgi:hypothetical protein
MSWWLGLVENRGMRDLAVCGRRTKVMISMKRQKAKKIPKSILTAYLLVREGVKVVDEVATRLPRGEVGR